MWKHDEEQSKPALAEVYTAFRILLKMRKLLGLEGMLEFIEGYVTKLNEAMPKLQKAVDSAEKDADVIAMAEHMKHKHKDMDGIDWTSLE